MELDAVLALCEAWKSGKVLLNSLPSLSTNEKGIGQKVETKIGVGWAGGMFSWEAR